MTTANVPCLTIEEYKQLKERLSLPELYVVERYYLDNAPFPIIVKECRARPAVIYETLDSALLILEHLREIEEQRMYR